MSYHEGWGPVPMPYLWPLLYDDSVEMLERRARGDPTLLDQTMEDEPREDSVFLGQRASLLAGCVVHGLVRGARWLLRQGYRPMYVNCADDMYTYDNYEPKLLSYLEVAIMRHDLEMVKMLLEHGASLSRDNEDLLRPIEFAQKQRSSSGHDSVCEIDQIIEIFKSEEQWLPKKRRRLSLETTPPTSAKDADLSVLLLDDSPIPSDFSITVAGGASVQCHKAILQSRSEYFAGLLRGTEADGPRFREVSEGRLVLEDVSLAEVLWLVRSIYKNEALPLPEEEDAAASEPEAAGGETKEQQEEGEGLGSAPLIQRLWYLTDRLGVAQFKEALEAEIKSRLNTTNVLSIMKWAQSSEAATVESICTEYLRRHAWEMVQQADTEQAGPLLEALKHLGPFHLVRSHAKTSQGS